MPSLQQEVWKYIQSNVFPVHSILYSMFTNCRYWAGRHKLQVRLRECRQWLPQVWPLPHSQDQHAYEIRPGNWLSLQCVRETLVMPCIILMTRLFLAVIHCTVPQFCNMYCSATSYNAETWYYNDSYNVLFTILWSCPVWLKKFVAICA